MDLFGIVGAGGFGREVMPVAREMLAASLKSKDHELVFIDEKVGEGALINGHRAMTESEFLAYDAHQKHFNIAVAESRTREAIANRMLANGIKPFTVAALNAVIYDKNLIGEGAILCAFTTVTSNAKIGRYFHSNIYSYVAHDCVIGDYVTFAPDVHCNGAVVIENYAYIGTGAVIRQGTPDKPVVIGEGAVVGMGAVVTKSVKPGATVVGNPAGELTKRS